MSAWYTRETSASDASGSSQRRVPRPVGVNAPSSMVSVGSPGARGPSGSKITGPRTAIAAAAVSDTTGTRYWRRPTSWCSTSRSSNPWESGRAAATSTLR